MLLVISRIYEILASHFFRDFQESFDTYRASWDVSGDPCPPVKFEWLIQRLDGKVVMDWLDMGGLYLSQFSYRTNNDLVHYKGFLKCKTGILTRC